MLRWFRKAKIKPEPSPSREEAISIAWMLYEAAVLAVSDAKRRGDTRAYHQAIEAKQAAKHNCLRAELGRAA